YYRCLASAGDRMGGRVTGDDAGEAGGALNQQDVQRLMSDSSPEVRAETAGKVASAFERGSLSTAERAIAEQIFRLMIRDAEVRVRTALSQRLKTSAELPHDVALALARDVEAVAIPMLESSAVLTDDDLVQIIGVQTFAAKAAIARRTTVSAPVA